MIIEVKEKPLVIAEAELQELLFLQEATKEMLTRISEIREKCKNIGSFCTENFTCSVYDQEQRRLVGLEDMVKVLDMEFLESHNLIKHLTFQIVKVTYRND